MTTQAALDFIPIIPIQHMTQLLANDSWAFALAHIEHPEYFETIFEFALKGKKIILDNGAFELGTSIPFSTILTRWSKVQLYEIALPDKLFDASETYNLHLEAVEYIRTMQSKNIELNFQRIMIIPQGETPEEWVMCLWKLTRDISRIFNFPLTLAIPKHMSAFPGGRHRLLTEYVRAWQRTFQPTMDLEIHLLGLAESYLDLRIIALAHEDILRSIDSAKPATYATYHEVIYPGLNLDPTFVYPGRPEDFFETELTNHQVGIVSQNIQNIRTSLRLPPEG